MTFLDLEEEHQSPPIYCNFIPSSLKEIFAQCHAFPIGRRSSPSSEEESPASDIEDQRVVFVLSLLFIFYMVRFNSFQNSCRSIGRVSPSITHKNTEIKWFDKNLPTEHDSTTNNSLVTRILNHFPMSSSNSLIFYPLSH